MKFATMRVNDINPDKEFSDHLSLLVRESQQSFKDRVKKALKKKFTFSLYAEDAEFIVMFYHSKIVKSDSLGDEWAIIFYDWAYGCKGIIKWLLKQDWKRNKRKITSEKLDLIVKRSIGEQRLIERNPEDEEECYD
jgi:hypothetical protein